MIIFSVFYIISSCASSNPLLMTLYLSDYVVKVVIRCFEVLILVSHRTI